MKEFKYIYGPVYSWRLGRSLGVDVLSRSDKACTFDCTYCQLGRTRIYTTKRKIFVPTKEIIKEIKALPKVNIDYITFSGRGEPTLAKNLGEVIREIKKIRSEKIAVLTNSSLMPDDQVKKELKLADEVICKLDGSSLATFTLVSKPDSGIRFESVKEGIIKFRSIFKGKLSLQLMFVKENKDEAQAMAKIASEVKVDEIQINTPTRSQEVEALSESEIQKIKSYFSRFNVISVYDKPRKSIKPISGEGTLRRGRGDV